MLPESLSAAPFFSRPSRVRMFLPSAQTAKIDTGINRFAVNDDGTGATFAYFTAFFDGSKTKMITQHIQKRFSRIHIFCYFFSVYHTLHKYFLSFLMPSSPPLTCRSAFWQAPQSGSVLFLQFLRQSAGEKLSMLSRNLADGFHFEYCPPVSDTDFLQVFCPFSNVLLSPYNDTVPVLLHQM